MGSERQWFPREFNQLDSGDTYLVMNAVDDTQTVIVMPDRMAILSVGELTTLIAQLETFLPGGEARQPALVP